MIFLIIAINLLITLLNIYIAVRMWQIKLLTARISKIIFNYEIYFCLLLKNAPQVIYQVQDKVIQTRNHYQVFQLRTAKLKQLVWLLNQSYRLWSRV